MWLMKVLRRERVLSEKFTNKTSRIKNHTDTLTTLGADSKRLHHMNAIISKVWLVELHYNTLSAFWSGIL